MKGDSLSAIGLWAMSLSPESASEFFRTKKYKHRDYRCISCLKDIPPGKAGRKCKECREPQNSL